MPTTTTTVTTTSATGTTTETVTVTTAESKVANPDVASLTAAVGEWGAGTLAANKAKYYSADCQIKAGRGTVPGWPASVTQDESFDAWCVPAAVHSVVLACRCLDHAHDIVHNVMHSQMCHRSTAAAHHSPPSCAHSSM